MLLVKLLANSRLSVVKFGGGGSQKLYTDWIFNCAEVGTPTQL